MLTVANSEGANSLSANELQIKGCCWRHLQVAVVAPRVAATAGQVTPGPTVKEAAVFIAAAVLVQEVPHLRLKEGHVHVDGDHLQDTSMDQ